MSERRQRGNRPHMIGAGKIPRRTQLSIVRALTVKCSATCCFEIIGGKSATSVSIGITCNSPVVECGDAEANGKLP